MHLHIHFYTPFVMLYFLVLLYYYSLLAHLHVASLLCGDVCVFYRLPPHSVLYRSNYNIIVFVCVELIIIHYL